MQNDKLLCKSTDELLIKKGKQGDSAAVEAIFKRYGGLVCFIASKYYMSGFEREDIIQEGMIGLYYAILNYDSEKTSFSSFAGLCINRKIISLLKSSKRQKHIPQESVLSLEGVLSSENGYSYMSVIEDEKSKNPEQIVISKETLSLYESKINELLSSFELEVWKCYTEAMTYKEISEKLGKNVKAIDNAVQRIRKKLMTAIG